MMKRRTILLTALVSACLPRKALALRAPATIPEMEEASDLIVEGEVVRIRKVVDGETIHYLAEVNISRVTKGEVEFVVSIGVHYWKRRPGAPVVLGGYGHRGLPEVGDAVRVYLQERGGRWHVFHANGFDYLDKEIRKKRLSEWDAPTMTGSR